MIKFDKTCQAFYKILSKNSLLPNKALNNFFVYIQINDIYVYALKNI